MERDNGYNSFCCCGCREQFITCDVTDFPRFCFAFLFFLLLLSKNSLPHKLLVFSEAISKFEMNNSFHPAQNAFNHLKQPMFASSDAAKDSNVDGNDSEFNKSSNVSSLPDIVKAQCAEEAMFLKQLQERGERSIQLCRDQKERDDILAMELSSVKKNPDSLNASANFGVERDTFDAEFLVNKYWVATTMNSFNTGTCSVGLSFVLQNLVTKESRAFWKKFAETQKEKFANCLHGVHGSVDTCNIFLDVFDAFNYNPHNEKLCVAFISRQPLEDLCRKIDLNMIEILMTVCTRDDLSFTGHMGIFRTVQSSALYREEKEIYIKYLAIPLHAFAGKAAKMLFPHNQKLTHMYTNPVSYMWVDMLSSTLISDKDRWDSTQWNHSRGSKAIFKAVMCHEVGDMYFRRDGVRCCVCNYPNFLNCLGYTSDNAKKVVITLNGLTNAWNKLVQLKLHSVRPCLHPEERAIKMKKIKVLKAIVEVLEKKKKKKQQNNDNNKYYEVLYGLNDINLIYNDAYYS